MELEQILGLLVQCQGAVKIEEIVAEIVVRSIVQMGCENNKNKRWIM